MRVNAANDLDFAVLPKSANAGRRIHIRMGWQRYTATLEEAALLARMIDAAIAQVASDEPPAPTTATEVSP